jgi:citrate lyase beta subunit
VVSSEQFGPHTASEVEAAVGAGAEGVFLPMVTRPAEVARFVGLIAGRAGAGILVETVEALARVGELRSFPLDRVYFGLNDFAISRGGGSIFCAVLDGSWRGLATRSPAPASASAGSPRPTPGILCPAGC